MTSSHNNKIPIWVCDPKLSSALHTLSLWAGTAPDLASVSRPVDTKSPGIWVVGGAVRDHLLNLPVYDIDAVIIGAQSSQAVTYPDSAPLGRPLSPRYRIWRAHIPPYVIDYATARVDTITDGRHAEVIVTDDLYSDSLRRDFTINAIYCDTIGNIWDPHGGVNDINNKIVRFVGDAYARIHEDYLRVLRLVRMLAHIGAIECSENALPVASQLAAAANDRLSRDRIGGEIMRILGANGLIGWIDNADVQRILAAFLPGGVNWASLSEYLSTCKQRKITPDPICALAVMYGGTRHRGSSDIRIKPHRETNYTTTSIASVYSKTVSSITNSDSSIHESEMIRAIRQNRNGHHGLADNAGIVKSLKDCLRLSRSQSRALHNRIDRIHVGLPVFD